MYQDWLKLPQLDLNYKKFADRETYGQATESRWSKMSLDQIRVVIRGKTLHKHILNCIIKPMNVKQLTLPCQFWRQSWSFGCFFSLLACSHILHNLIRTSQSSTLPVWAPIIEQCPRWKSLDIFTHEHIFIFKKNELYWI